jgi:aspartate/methionine/tyrosine aminotransferase
MATHLSDAPPSAFQPFELERWQSDWEHTVEINLADSSVRAVSLGEVLGGDPANLERLLGLSVHYPMVNGTAALRERIAALYEGARADQVMVTVGAAEANQIICQALLEPGDGVVAMEPGYRQVWGLAKNLGCDVRAFHLIEERGWRPDLDALEAVVDGRTKLISVVNPNNPTGTILTEREMARIVAIAERVGAWLLADEVYRGAERHTDEETPSFWGRYDRVLAVGSLSKAYGLSGTRIGWVVAPSDLIAALWRRHEYAVIAAAAPSMLLGELALAEPMRESLIARQRELTRAGWRVIENWIATNTDVVSLGPSAATSIAFVRYAAARSSVEVADEIRRRASVLVAPGELLGGTQHLRITHGYPPEIVTDALGRVAAVLRAME